MQAGDFSCQPPTEVAAEVMLISPAFLSLDPFINHLNRKLQGKALLAVLRSAGTWDAVIKQCIKKCSRNASLLIAVNAHAVFIYSSGKARIATDT